LAASLLTLFNFLLWLAAGAASLFTVFGFFSRLDWRLELFSHFRAQYCLLLSACGLLFLLLGHWPGFLFSTAFMGANLALLLPIYRRPARRCQSGPIYRIFFANVLGPNTCYERILDAITKAKADILLLVEVRPNHLQALQPALGDYPYYFSLPDTDNFGLAIFSRLPLESAEALAFDGTCTPMLFARLTLAGHRLSLLGVHPWPPKSREKAARRNHQLALTAAFTVTQTGELLLFGDLNTTSWSHAFRQLRSKSRLLDSRQGFGLQPSWPANNCLLAIPIDHALHTPGICIHARKLGARTGSDHLPLIIDLSINLK
jgi:endonuclease/exonuclease/phosphatase (EEP) superfamily protein YafD